MKTTSQITQAQLEQCELEHSRAGNGYAMVEVLDSEWIRVTPMNNDHFCNRAQLAAMSEIKVFQTRQVPDDPQSPLMDVPIKSNKLQELAKLRINIKNGTMRVVDQKVIPT